MTCPKCHGTGWYQYDDTLIKKCDACCAHDQGWVELTDGFAGYVAGADNRCCRAGCGTMYRDMETNNDDRNR